MFKLVPQQFFPPSNRAEILVDLKLEEGASLTATEQAVHKVEQFLSKQKGIDNWEVDTNNPDKILTIESNGASEDDVKSTLQKIGFKAESVNSK